MPLGEVGLGIGGQQASGRYCESMPSYYRDPDAPAPNVPRRSRCDRADRARRGDPRRASRRTTPTDGRSSAARSRRTSTSLDALHREVREETGFAIEHAELLGVFSDPTRIVAYPDGNICRILSIAFRVTPQRARASRSPATSRQGCGSSRVTSSSAWRSGRRISRSWTPFCASRTFQSSNDRDPRRRRSSSA